MNYLADLLVACALKKEAGALRNELGPSLRILSTGLGTDRTLETLERLFEEQPPSLLIFTGMAGQLAPKLELGDFVFPEAWATEGGATFHVNRDLLQTLRERGRAIEGLGITVRRPVVRRAARADLHRRTGGVICDMESAAVLMISESFGVPCLAPKVVSDTADSGMLAFQRHFDAHIRILAAQLKSLIEGLRD